MSDVPFATGRPPNVEAGAASGVHSRRSLPAAGEVIEASTTHSIARCPQERLHHPPAFGTFVKVVPGAATSPAADAEARGDDVDPFADPTPSSLPPGTPDGTLYALVYQATTGCVEQGRRPAAYGLSEAELRDQQPQIFELLCTEFAARHVGFAQEERVRPYLPPRPPNLHAFVVECSPVEVCALTDSLDFLRALLSTPGEAGPDELIAACLRHAYACRDRDFAFLVRAGKLLANLLRDDPERLAALLRKLEP